MSDLIQQLNAFGNEGCDCHVCGLRREAAAEIERLEKMAESRYAEKRDLVAEVAVALVDAGVSRFGYLKEGVEKLAEKLSSSERQRDEAIADAERHRWLTRDSAGTILREVFDRDDDTIAHTLEGRIEQVNELIDARRQSKA